MRSTRWRRGLGTSSLAILWIGTLALVGSLWLFHGRNFNRLPGASYQRVSDGEAARPYDARVLVPWTAKLLLSPVSGETRRAWVDGWVERDPARERWLRFFEIDRDHAVELAVAVALDALALVGFAVGLRRLFSRLYVTSAEVAWVVPVVALLLLPLFFGKGNHFVYDLPALCFFTLALDALARGSIRWLYALLPLGTLNKETAALALLLLLAPTFRERFPASWRHHLAGLAGAVAVARLAAVVLTGSAPAAGGLGGYLRSYFLLNAAVFVRDPFLLHFETVAALLLFAFLVFAKLDEKPRFLVEALPVVVLFAALYLWGGQWGEIRALLDVYPILFLLGFQTFARRLGIGVAPRSADVAGGGEPAALPAWGPLGAATAALLGVFHLTAGVVLALGMLRGFQG